jgi:hypothetical protein
MTNAKERNRNLKPTNWKTFHDPNDPKKMLLQIDLSDWKRPGTLRISRCSIEQLEALSQACQQGIEEFKNQRPF